ncbi:MAG: DNA mismatch repair endonuclease MutL [Verrucomicrobiota bacterium]|nr:DNA mismatch repair endonuclease MutL [Verrucomicrobiota bacterium]
MNRITVLSEKVANQIAAGEVVERPASIVKELIENSLDAGAKRIDVEIKGGGKSLIRITDDGCGMSRDDALLCLERHATSKIKNADDLLSIGSFGFRGEAIPSIASVSRFKIMTREKEAAEGSEVIIHGGTIQGVQSCGSPSGTSIEVRSLFYNLPARKKFLKSDITELAHIQQGILIQALSNPAVGFFYRQDDRVVYQLASAQSLASRILEIYGAPFFNELLPLDHQSYGLKITGYVGRPGVSRSNRSEQHSFINGRPVENRILNFGLMEGYHNALMKGRYPVCMLFISMDPALVDVNVHPSKKEVRFRDEPAVRAAIVQAVREALAKTQGSIEVTITDKKTSGEVVAQNPTFTPSAPPFSMGNVPIVLRSESSGTPTTFTPSFNFQQTPRPLSPNPSFANASISETAQPNPGPSPVGGQMKNIPYRLLGIISNLYIIGESAEGIVFIDQHAAHERVLFEKLLKHLENQDIASQRLLMPETVELDPRDEAFLKENLEVLNKIGIGISSFGGNTVMIDSLPPWLLSVSPRLLLKDVLDSLQSEGGRTSRDRRFREEQIAKAACRAAVKANDPLSLFEAERLLSDLLKCELPYTCPHGRPTMILITARELEKKFGRIV